jgi:hypothetical protein
MGPAQRRKKCSDSGPCSGRDDYGGRGGTTAPGAGPRPRLCACAAAHGQDARRVVAAGLQEALEPALEARGPWPPLAQREDAGCMVAGAVQQLVQAAGARLLATAVGQRLCGSPR